MIYVENVTKVNFFFVLTSSLPLAQLISWRSGSYSLMKKKAFTICVTEWMTECGKRVEKLKQIRSHSQVNKFILHLPDVKTKAMARHWWITFKFSKYAANKLIDILLSILWMRRLNERQTGRMITIHKILIHVAVLCAMHNPFWKFIYIYWIENNTTP